MKKKGLSLVEIIVATGIFTAIFVAVLGVMVASDANWRVGRNKLAEQQETRRLMDNIVRMLRQTRAEWVTISNHVATDDQLLFFRAAFSADGIMSPGNWVVVRPYGLDPTRIRMLEEGGSWQVIGQSNSLFRFGGGCANCASYTCSTPHATCPTVKVDIGSLQGNGFNMTTYVTFRNNDLSGVSGTPVPPDPGELSG